MSEPKGNDVQRTLAVRVSPDYHAQLSMVAQVDEMSLTDLMMTALDRYMASRRESEDFKAKVQKALEEAEAQMARTRRVIHSSYYRVFSDGNSGDWIGEMLSTFSQPKMNIY